MDWFEALSYVAVLLLPICLVLVLWVLNADDPASVSDWRTKFLTAAFVFLTAFFALEVLKRPTFSLGEASGRLVAYSLVLWVGMTSSLVRRSTRLTARWTKSWVKSLDFPYLFFGFLGLVQLVNRSPNVSDRIDLDALAAVAVATALAIRLTRTTLETFFDKRISGS